MTVYFSAQFSIRNRLPALLIKVEACGERTNQLRIYRETLFFLGYQIHRNCQACDLSPHILMRIGLDKLRERAKGINNPKYSVQPEYACLKRESASCVYL